VYVCVHACVIDMGIRSVPDALEARGYPTRR